MSFVGLVLLVIARAGVAPLAVSQMQALESLYYSTDGPNWYLNSLNGPGKAWNFSKTAAGAAGGAYLSDPCSNA